MESDMNINLMRDKRILHIGQAPKELGGSLTTGVSNVIRELFNNKIEGYEMILYATNISNEIAENISTHRITGYSKNLFNDYLLPIISSPIKTIRELFLYFKIGVKPLRYLFYRLNISRCIKSFNPDIIHNHGISQFLPTFLLLIISRYY